MINMDILLCESVVKNNILNLLSDALQYFCVIIVDMKYISSISDVHVLYVANYCFMFCSKLIISDRGMFAVSKLLYRCCTTLD